jgi:cAMP-dependent protein kinase regulator
LASEKAKLTENVQKYVQKSDWKNAIAELEKLFAIDQDPQVKVRMGDIRQKMNQKPQAVNEYMKAADLFADKGFVVKALAMYKLVLRLDPSHSKALDQMASLHSNKAVSELKLEPVELGEAAPQSSVVPLFADLTQEEFNDFTTRMVFHTVPAGQAIIKEGETGASVFVVTRGTVKVTTSMEGKSVDLAVLQPSDFFGEIAFLTGKPRTATVTAAEECDILEVPEAQLKDLIAAKPRIRDVMQNYYNQRVASTLQKLKGIG